MNFNIDPDDYYSNFDPIRDANNPYYTEEEEYESLNEEEYNNFQLSLEQD